MGIFKKKGDVIDFTYLQKRGLLKNEEKTEDVIDFTQQNNQASDGLSALANLADSQTLNTNNSSPLNFLDNASTSSVYGQEENKPDEQIGKINEDVMNIKVKIDDLEYKLEKFLEKVDKIEERLIEFERNARFH